MAIILPKREQEIIKTTSNDPTGQQITYGTTVLMEPLLLDDGQLLLCPSVDIYGKLLASYELWRIPEIRKAACSAAGLPEGFFMQEIEESKTEFLHIQNIRTSYIKVTHPNPPPHLARNTTKEMYSCRK